MSNESEKVEENVRKSNFSAQKVKENSPSLAASKFVESKTMKSSILVAPHQVSTSHQLL
jgi:hypothetical protein